MHFKGLFKNIVFRSVTIVTKMLWAILDFFFADRTFFPPCTLPYKLKKKYFSTKNYLNYYSLSHKILRDSVKNWSVSTKNSKGWAPNAPPPISLGLIPNWFQELINFYYLKGL